MAKRIGSALLLLTLASPVQAVTMTFGDIEITPEPAPKGTSAHGYFEYVFHMVNTSAERAHTVRLSMPSEKLFFHEDSIHELRRTVQVGPKETVHVSLLQPDHPPIGGRDVAVVIDGRRQENALPLKPSESVRRYSYRGRGWRVRSPAPAELLILLGPRVKPLPVLDPTPPEPGMPMPGGALLPSHLKGPTRSKLPPGMPPERPPAARPPTKPGLPSHGIQFVTAETWSSNWLAYTRYDGIILTAEELKELPAATQTALRQYVETGGALLVLGPTDLRGLSAVTQTEKDKAGWRNIQAGLGVCHISPDAHYDAWDVERFTQLFHEWQYANGSGIESQRNTLDANRELPVIDDLGIPIRGLFVLMFVFVLAIGPVNVFVLSRLKRRIWLLWTTPALSLCTCLAVFGYMLISEGWSGRLRSETLTLLDETTHRATTIGWLGVYSPLTPGDGLHFSAETEVIPQRFFEGSNGGARSCTIDWSQDQHFAAGWVEARIPAHFKVRKSELRRERVALHREGDGRWSMVNGLGTAIRHFWYADAQGQIHEAKDIAPGARTLLTPTEKECPVNARTLRDHLFGPGNMSFMTTLQLMGQAPQNYLRPGSYLAEVEASPFLEDALRNARTRKLHAFIVGFGKQDENGE